jgi:hypothetical protein
MKSLRLHINGTGIEFDRGYGIARRTGWTAVHRGVSVFPYFTSLSRAVAVLCVVLFRDR